MTDLRAQRRLAADEMDVGENKIWFDPMAQGDIAAAITREEIRELIEEGLIQAEERRSNSRGRARERNEKRAYGHRKGPGKRKGKRGGRENAREKWRGDIRAQREKLRSLREAGELTPTEYRELYRKAAGGEFRSVRYMLNYIDEHYGDE